jgi:hypothetical protein
MPGAACDKLDLVSRSSARPVAGWRENIVLKIVAPAISAANSTTARSRAPPD